VQIKGPHPRAPDSSSRANRADQRQREGSRRLRNALPNPDVQLRLATGGGTDAAVTLYDEAVVWLAARGRSDQWGITPFSARPEVVDLIRRRAGSGRMRLADNGEQPVAPS
jgi:hypothetical protein